MIEGWQDKGKSITRKKHIFFMVGEVNELKNQKDNFFFGVQYNNLSKLKPICVKVPFPSLTDASLIFWNMVWL